MHVTTVKKKDSFIPYQIFMLNN